MGEFFKAFRAHRLKIEEIKQWGNFVF